MSLRRMNPAILLIVVALLLPGVPLQCKPSCTMAAKLVKASASSTSNCCKNEQFSSEVQREVPTIRGSHASCCISGTPIPSGTTEAQNVERTNFETRADNATVSADPCADSNATALAQSDVSPPSTTKLSIIVRVTLLRI